MRMYGPCVKVSVEIAGFIERRWLEDSKDRTAPIKGYALIDTGASDTCIDDSVARRLGLPVVDVVNVSSASHASTLQSVYPIKIAIEGFSVSIEAPTAIGAALSSQGLIALIGRDLLQYCTLFYNGVSGELTLSI
jgi:predicted aspartyl protease